ncbi:MAG: urate hydroxylase PuuD [Elusimicrobia bacterium]|nr:urate hydroxylase PuuD [Elusimicrobiota bacterium]
MALTDFYNNFHLFMRWFHVLFGIVWVGHLFFFNFVNIQLQASMDDTTKKAVNPQLIPRALWWFRWSAMGTFLSGWILFSMVYMYQPGLWGPTAFFSNAEGVTGRAWWILIGMILGSLMWFNVWFIIWPAQKSLFGLGVPKASPEIVPILKSRSALFSRINTFLSGPMLFGMMAAAHYSAINLTTFLVFSAIGLAFIWAFYWLSVRVSPLTD